MTEFVNPAFSADKPLVSLSFNQRERFMHPHHFGQPGYVEAEAKLRSPFLQYRAREMAKDLIQEPLQDAWRNREFDGSAALALGLGLGGVAAAVNSSSEIKTRVDLYKGTLPFRMPVFRPDSGMVDRVCQIKGAQWSTDMSVVNRFRISFTLIIYNW